MSYDILQPSKIQFGLPGPESSHLFIYILELAFLCVGLYTDVTLQPLTPFFWSPMESTTGCRAMGLCLLTLCSGVVPLWLKCFLI